MADYGIFRTNDAKRIAAATRRVEGTPGVHLRVPDRVPRNISVPEPRFRGDPSFGAPWTIREYNAVTGEVFRNFDRGRGRFGGGSGTFDAEILLSADEEFLYAWGNGAFPDPGKTHRLAKYDINSGERLWYSDEGSFTEGSPTLSPAVRSDQCLIEADDGYIWACSGPGASNNGEVGRYDPDTGNQTHTFTEANNFGFQLLACPTSGSIVVANSTAVGGKYIRILDDTLTETHSYSTSYTCVEEFGGRLYVLTATSIVILDASDLSTIDSRAGTGGSDTYLCLTTDGATVWVSTTTGANSRYRAYDATNLATQIYSTARDTANADTWRMIYANSNLYDFSQIPRKIDPTTGNETWSAGTSNLGQLNRRTGAAVGSNFTVSCQNTSGHLYCINDSDGSTRWTDTNTSPQCVVVTSDDRVFMCCQRTGPA